MRYFEVPYKSTRLKGTIYGVSDPRVFFVHGSSKDGSARFDMIRQHLAKTGIASAAFDFIGHGETGGVIDGTTLADRLKQACTVIDSIHCKKPLIIIGASMGADTAIRLTKLYPVATLMLFVPAFYSPNAFKASFKEEFHDVIIREDGWKSSDAWALLKDFLGSLLVVGAEHDEVIPGGIYDALDEHSPLVSYKELITVPGSPHRVLPFLSENPGEFARVFERVYQAIVSAHHLDRHTS